MTKLLRVLHVVGGMNRGGSETWLMHVLRHINREQFEVDFMVHTQDPCDFDPEIKSLGSRIIPCMGISNPLKYRRNFMRIMREFGPYDVVHSHVHHFSGYILWLAYQAAVPVRIAHSHSDTLDIDRASALPRRMYLSVMKTLIARYATIGLAASAQAAPALFGINWKNDPRRRVFYCAINMEPFEANQKPDINLRKELRIPEDAFVIGHVGRFMTQKNHIFILRVALEVIKRHPNVRFLLLGDGPLRSEIERQVSRLGLTDYFVFAGVRSDVPYIMKAVMNVFFLPSLYEGLPLVGMEAQAAGLPVIISDSVSSEVSIVPQLVTVKSLTQPIADWADALLTYLRIPLPISGNEALSTAKESPFNIQHNIKALEQLYLG